MTEKEREIAAVMAYIERKGGATVNQIAKTMLDAEIYMPTEKTFCVRTASESWARRRITPLLRRGKISEVYRASIDGGTLFVPAKKR